MSSGCSCVLLCEFSVPNGRKRYSGGLQTRLLAVFRSSSPSIICAARHTTCGAGPGLRSDEYRVVGAFVSLCESNGDIAPSALISVDTFSFASMRRYDPATACHGELTFIVDADVREASAEVRQNSKPLLRGGL